MVKRGLSVATIAAQAGGYIDAGQWWRCAPHSA